MINNLVKIIVFVIILFMLFQMNFATNTQNNDLDSQTSSMESIYFDASSLSDGNGTQSNPYKYLYENRIKENTNIHLSNGEYFLDKAKNINNISIHGTDSDKTIIHYNGVAFNVINSLFVENLTLKGISINNTYKLTVKNTIFDNGSGVLTDSSNNTCGGAIYTGSNYKNAIVNVVNSTFANTHSEYGAAIYMANGVLNIEEAQFKNTYSYNFGGAISCEGVRITISKSRFINTTSVNDAGGAIYIKSSTLVASYLNISNSKADFGGAITSLKSSLSIIYSDFSTNEAKYFGGAIYQFYGNLYISNSNFNNNTAVKGCDLYANNLSQFEVYDNNLSDVCQINSLKELSIISQNYTLIKNNKTVTTLPSYYSLIDENHVTSVKNQASTGNCWAFTAIAVLESCILKATNKSYDLSEENLKNLMALYSDYGWNVETNNGGYYNMPLGYLTSWLGPVFENEDEFDDKSTLSPFINSTFHVQNILFLNTTEDIKKALIQYGAVGVGMAYYNNFFNNNTNSYYCFLNNPENHAATIVGWDDNYSKDNFKYSKYIEGDGAWLVKNSWGEKWGDKGYFYISYYDAKLGSENLAYTVIFNDTLKYDKNYQYDIAGMTNYFKNISRKVWYKNIFKASDNEFLAGVSTYFEKSTNWTLTIKVNNITKLIKNGIANAGYYTIKLDFLIPLNKNDIFEVIFNTTVSGKSSFPISEVKSLNKLSYTSGISFLSYDNRNWQDLSNLSFTFLKDNYSSQVACIKAFTVLNPIDVNLSLNVGDEEVIVKVCDEYGNFLNNVNVTLNIDGEKHIVNVDNGIARLAKAVKNFIFVEFKADGYKYCKCSKTFNSDLKINYQIIENNIFIVVENESNIDLIAYINNIEYNISNNSLNLKNLKNDIYDICIASSDGHVLDNKEIVIDFKKTYIQVFKNKIKLIDCDGIGILNKTLNISLNNNNYQLLTDTDGIVNLSINKDSKLHVYFEGDEKYSKSNISKYIYLVNVNVSEVISKDCVLISINLSKKIDEALTVKINNVSYLYNESLKLFNLSNGAYNINIALDSSDYILSNDSFSFTVNFKKTHFVFDDVNPQSNKSFVLCGKLLDEYECPVRGVNVNVALSNKSFILKTDNQGIFNINLTLLEGIHDFNAYFKGNDGYLKTNSSFKISVSKNILIKTKIQAFNLTTYFKSNEAFKATLMDDEGNLLDGECIEFSLDNKTYLKKTNNKGIAFININLANANYILNITYNGSDKFESSNCLSSINVISSMITPSSQIWTYNSNYAVKILDNYGNPLINSWIKFVLNNKSFLKMTDSQGYVYLNICVDQGIYSLQIINLANDETIFKNIQVVSRISLNKDITTFEGSVDYYKVLVLNDNGKPKANAVVNVKINGKSANIKSDGKGYAFFKINLKKGVYNISCEYNSFKVYNKITVKPLLIVHDISKKKSKSYKISVKLNKKVKGKKIIFKIKNKKFVFKINKKNIVSVNFKVKLKKGIYKIQVIYLNFKTSFKLKIL